MPRPAPNSPKAWALESDAGQRPMTHRSRTRLRPPERPGPGPLTQAAAGCGGFFVAGRHSRMLPDPEVIVPGCRIGLRPNPCRPVRFRARGAAERLGTVLPRVVRRADQG